jgi:hypothetical protein
MIAAGSLGDSRSPASASDTKSATPRPTSVAADRTPRSRRRGATNSRTPPPASSSSAFMFIPRYPLPRARDTTRLARSVATRAPQTRAACWRIYAGATVTCRMSERVHNTVRGVAFLAILAWMVGNPAYRQMAGGTNPHLRAWVMFAGIGLGGIDARFHVRSENGALEEVDRWEHTRRKRPSRGTKRRIRNRAALDQEILRLCRALGPDTDLRVSARQAKRRGWIWIKEQEESACEGAADRRRKARRK